MEIGIVRYHIVMTICGGLGLGLGSPISPALGSLFNNFDNLVLQ